MLSLPKQLAGSSNFLVLRLLPSAKCLSELSSTDVKYTYLPGAAAPCAAAGLVGSPT